jgi:uncharacterized membrane protein
VRHAKGLWLGVLAVVGPLAGEAEAEKMYSVSRLGGSEQQLIAINNAGQVLIKSSNMNEETNEFTQRFNLYNSLGTTAGTTREVSRIQYSYPESGGFEPTALNDRGQVAGNLINPDVSGTRAAVWRDGTITELEAPAGSTQANAINNRGDVVGLAFGPDSSDPTVLLNRDGVTTNLGRFGGDGAGARSINNAGQIAVSVLSGSFSPDSVPKVTALIYDTVNGTSTPVPIPEGKLGFISALNDHGVGIGSYISVPWSTEPSTGFYFDGALHEIPGPVGGSFEPVGINNLGQIVGNMTMPITDWWEPPTNSSALYENGEITPLDSLLLPGSGWMVASVAGINDLGQILAYGTQAGDGSGPLPQYATLLLSPTDLSVPEPSVLATAAMVGLGLAVRKTRKRSRGLYSAGLRLMRL